MINQVTKQHLRDYFDLLSQIEYGAEKYRKQICECEHFEPYSFWVQLTQDSNQLNLLEMKKQFPCLPVSGLSNIFILFDNNSDGNLDYSDFFQMVTTIDDPYLRQDITFRKCTTQLSLLKCCSYFQLLLEYFCEEFEKLQLIKRLIVCQIDYNVYLAYHSMKKCKIDRYSFRLISKEISFQDKNTISFKDFYKILSHKDHWPINEMFGLMDGKINIADKVMNSLTETQLFYSKNSQTSVNNRNIILQNNYCNSSKRKKIISNKVLSQSPSKMNNYFSVQTNNQNQTKILESIQTSHFNY